MAADVGGAPVELVLLTAWIVFDAHTHPLASRNQNRSMLMHDALGHTCMHGHVAVHCTA